MNESGAKVEILYASETGNCEEVAERVWRAIDANFVNLKCSFDSMDEYDVRQLIDESFVIFICSTTNDGDEPATMRSFWRFLLRKNLPADSLVNLRCIVLGLGDSSYSKFNYAAKRLSKRLVQLGAELVLKNYWADDQHDFGYDSIVVGWLDEVLQTISIQFQQSAVHFQNENSLPFKPKWTFKKVRTSLSSDVNHIYARDGVRFAKIVRKERVTAEDHFQNVILIRFEIDEEVDAGDRKPLDYKAGDLMELRPWNSREQIQDFFRILATNRFIDTNGCYGNETVATGCKLPDVLKKPYSFRKLSEEYWNLNAVPRRYAFRVLAASAAAAVLITSDQRERNACELEHAKLIELSSPNGLDDLYAYANRPKRSIVEILGDFPHATANLTIDMLFAVMPVIKPRLFSIASSCYESEGLSILVAVVRYRTVMKKDRIGLCSNWLNDVEVNSDANVRIPFEIRSGTFRFPDHKLKSNVIMIGPGTGIAPFRSFISQRIHEQKNRKETDRLLLFFGCRNRTKDFFFENDFRTIETTRRNSCEFQLICAFSRDQPQKIYVQHKILEHHKTVWEMLNETGNVYIFVAGNANSMPRDVREALVQVASKYLDSAADAEQFLQTLEKRNRFQIESWS